MPPNKPQQAPPRKLTLRDQASALLHVLSGMGTGLPRNNGYEQVLKYVQDIPPTLRTEEMYGHVRRVYGMTQGELLTALRTGTAIPDFDALSPQDGWLHDYLEYTRLTEPPTVFHYFVALTTIGATLARRVWYDRGYAHLFPNLCVVIVAPTGKCRKTSACNLGIKLLRNVRAAEILADKATPEALTTSFEGRENSTGLIYAPELAVFLGRQKYNDGMVPLLTALFDSPEVFRTKTVTRGELELKNVCLSFLGCSTMDWIQTAIPKDAFGGGFMSRLLFVVQSDTPRVFPDPPPPDKELVAKLQRRLLAIQKMHGQYKTTPAAKDWFDAWYRARKDTHTDNKQFAGYYERKPDHLFRLAMCLAVTRSNEMVLTVDTMQEALGILDWLELHLPDTFEQMQRTEIGEEQERVLTLFKKNNGEMPWAVLVGRCNKWTNAQRLKGIVESLREANFLLRDGTMLYLSQEGWK